MVEVDGGGCRPSASATCSSTSRLEWCTTARDPQGRATVVDLVLRDQRLVPVGRLDVDTTGALLLTNDGKLAHRLAHPRYGVEKVYEAASKGRRRWTISPGSVTGSSSTTGLRPLPVLGRHAGNATRPPSSYTCTRGGTSQVKRMCEAIGHPYATCMGSEFAPELDLEGLAPGEWRELAAKEVAGLRLGVGL